jgi:hypothetical protein
MPALGTLVERGLCLRGELVGRDGLLICAGVVAAEEECAAFRLWADGLPAKGHEALTQLRQYGFVYDLGRLEAELKRALPHASLVRTAGQRLLGLLARGRGAACFLLGEC